jgi:fucose permease
MRHAGALTDPVSPTYHRGRFTWAAYGALLAFGFLNAALGPALPYLRAVEHITYLVGALHQFAFAIGGGLAGIVASRHTSPLGRATTVRLGLAGAAIAGLAVGYGNRVEITVPATLVMGFLNTSALIALWAALSDAHRTRRAVAMTEGEVAVSLGGVVIPLLVAGLAATAATWRFSFVVAGGVVAAAVLGSAAVAFPAATPPRRPPASPAGTSGHTSRPALTLVIIFAIVALEFGLSFWLASYLNVSVGLSRSLAVGLVAALYGANLAGRVVTSRLARRMAPERVLALAMGTSLAGLPILLSATSLVAATLGFVLTGLGIGAMFPLTSSLHVSDSPRGADSALGHILIVAALGQTLGPLTVAVIAQVAGLRVGLMTLPALVIIAAAGLAGYHRQARPSPAPITRGSPDGSRNRGSCWSPMP